MVKLLSRVNLGVGDGLVVFPPGLGSKISGVVCVTA